MVHAHGSAVQEGDPYCKHGSCKSLLITSAGGPDGGKCADVMQFSEDPRLKFSKVLLSMQVATSQMMHMTQQDCK